jgi:uncharacterized protein DUF6538
MFKPILHDGNYYHRRRVPKDIAATFGKIEVWEPPNTRSLTEAKRALPNAMVAVDQRFDAHRTPLGRNVVTLVPRVPEQPAVAVSVVRRTLQLVPGSCRALPHRFKKATKHLDAGRAADVQGLPIISKTANNNINTVSSLFDWHS